MHVRLSRHALEYSGKLVIRKQSMLEGVTFLLPAFSDTKRFYSFTCILTFIQRNSEGELDKGANLGHFVRG